MSTTNGFRLPTRVVDSRRHQNMLYIDFHSMFRCVIIKNTLTNINNVEQRRKNLMEFPYRWSFFCIECGQHYVAFY